MHSFCGETLLHCKSIVDQVGAARWKEFEDGLQQILSGCRAVHKEGWATHVPPG